jgi:hypothetical protein
MLIDYFPKPVRSNLNSFIPAGVDESSKSLHHGLLKAHWTIDMFMKIPPLYTEFPLAHGMRLHRDGTFKFTVNRLKQQTASGATIRAD